MNRFLNRVSTLFLMLLSVIPLVHLVLCSFGLEADQRLPLFLLAAVLFCWLVFSFLPYKLAGLLPCAALIVLFCLGRRELLSAQFNDILDRVAVTYYLRFGSNEQVTLISQVQSHTEALLILGLGLVAFVMDTVGGVMLARGMNCFLKEKLNPMIGAAGISAFPMSTRVVAQMGFAEDKQNYLLMQAAAVNVSGQIASVIAGGLILTLAGG